MRDSLRIIKNIFRDRWLLYLAAFLIVILFAFFYFSNQFLSRDLSANLFTESIGIWITVFILDFIVNFNEEKRNDKLRSIALRHIRGLFNRLQDCLIDQYATAAGLPKSADLANQVFSEEVALCICAELKLDTKAPVIYEIPVDWAGHLRQFSERSRENIDLLLDKYVLFIPEEIVDVLERIKGDAVLEIYSVIRTMRQSRVNMSLPDTHLQGMAVLYVELFNKLLALDHLLKKYRI